VYIGMEVKLEMKSGVQETEPRAHARSYWLGSALHAPFDDAKHMHLSGSCGLCLHLFGANQHNLVIMTATGTLFFPCGCLRLWQQPGPCFSRVAVWDAMHSLHQMLDWKLQLTCQLFINFRTQILRRIFTEVCRQISFNSLSSGVGVKKGTV
jgi:hypothetical protein